MADKLNSYLDKIKINEEKYFKEFVERMNKKGKMVSDERKDYLFEKIIKNINLPMTEFNRLADMGPFQINEGLITTYPTETVVRLLGNLFHLKQNNNLPWYKNDEYIGTINASIENQEEVIDIHCLYDERIIKEMEAYFERYGWVKAYALKNNNRTIDIRLDKKFTGYVTPKLMMRYGGEYLYHISNNRLKEKILKNGLIPHSGNNGYNHPSRVYCLLKEPDNFDADTWGKQGHSDRVPVVFQIDLSKLNQNQKFYFDARTDNSFYTEEPISPLAITVIIPREDLYR